MTVTIVPNQEVLAAGAGFQLQPIGTVPLFQTNPRLGLAPILYETINPAMSITVQAVGGCPEPFLDLITSVTLVPGQGPSGGTGLGNSIVSLIDIADKPVPNIPNFSMSAGWVEPRMAYGSIAGPPSPTMTLVAPLKGYYGEKYFYDAEYVYASYYAKSPSFQGAFYDTIAEGVVPDVNRLTAINLLQGRKFLEFSNIPPDAEEITLEMFPPPAIPITLEQLAPITEADVLTEGSDYIAAFIPEISSWVKWRPSFIGVMQYYYTLIVTHTCPPFVTTFQGTMLVANNWTPAANRLSYYIDRQVGFLDTPTGDFELIT
jgi:hypothetical protein